MTENQLPEPPLGLRPQYIVQDLRIKEINEAIERYKKAGYPIPVPWKIELQYLMSIINIRRDIKEGI